MARRPTPVRSIRTSKGIDLRNSAPRKETKAHPFVDEWMALPVRHQAGEDEHRLVRLEAGDTRENRSLSASEHGQDPIVQPADDGTQAPQEVHPRPRRFGSAALGNGLGHAMPAGGEDEAVTVRKHFRRQVAVAGHEVFGCVQDQRLGVPVDHEAQARRYGEGATGTAALGACGLESAHCRFAVVEFAPEQRERRGRDGGRSGRSFVGLRLQKHRQKAFALVRFGGPAFVEISVGFSARYGLPCDVLLHLDVMHAHEH